MPTGTIKVTLPPLHPVQQEVFNHPARFKVLVAGRRFGKSRLAATYVASRLLAGKNVWWVAPTFDISKRVGWRMIETLFLPLVRAGYATANKSDLLITLPNGGRFQAKTADDPQKLVGEGLDAVVIDEAGIVRERTWQESIRPSLSDRLGEALLIGTPKGRNWFYFAYLAGQDPASTEWASWRVSSALNPFMSPAEIDAAQQELPERVFAQEYLAEFLEDSGAVFRKVQEACTAPLDAQPSDHAEHSIVIGADWAKASDFTVLTVGCKTCGCMVDFDRFNQIDYVFQVGRLADLVDKWGGTGSVTVHAETNSMGEAVIEQVERRGITVIPFTTTTTSKPPLIEDVALAIERHEIALQHIPVMVGELQAYTMTLSKYTGRPQYAAPDGMNDDTVMSLALCWHGMRRAMGGELLAFV
jgi:hypothetical protein